MNDLNIAVRQVPPALRKCSILIADDSITHRKIVEWHLRQAGFEDLVLAADGRQALALIDRHAPDLVLLDLAMPVLDGFGVCEALRCQPQYSDLAILVMTSLESVENRLRALAVGATDVILKPVYQAQLITHAIIHLERRLLIRGLREYQERTATELAIARQMQEALLPDPRVIRQLHDRYDIDVAALFKPSAELGGDLWGIWPIDASRFGIFIGDVSGHGTIAAIDTFRVHTILTRNDSDRSEPGRFLSAVNDQLSGLLSPGHYVTMLYGVLDTQRDQFSYAAAGCPEPMLALPSAPLRGLDGSGLPLGITGGVEYLTRHAPFTPGSFILLHSDAFPEARLREDGTLLGEERARALAADAMASKSPESAVASLFQAMTDLSNDSLDDDLTLICIGRPETEAAVTGDPAPAGSTAVRKRLLVVAPTLLRRMAVKQTAGSVGLDADGAADLAIAGRFLAAFNYDALVVDLQLPPNEVLELFRTIAGIGSQSRLILVGPSSEDLVRLAASLGLRVTTTLPEPLDVPMLRQALLAGPADEERAPGHEIRGSMTEADLLHALAEEEVTFGFQPQISLSTGQVVGAEALVRWTSPQHGMVPPEVFLSLVAKGGAAGLLTDVTVRVAAAACAGWRTKLPGMRVAVNFSAAALADVSLPALIENRLQEAGIPPEALVVEVVEADATASLPTLTALRQFGCHIALEEFSSVSLQTIERLPISMLKLGRLLVQQCATDASAMRLLTAAVGVGRAFGMHLGAVGVQSHAVEQALREAGCDMVQGWFYGPALSVEAISEALVHEQPWVAPGWMA
jgi:EAL domain-containing protein (putative c-di-GMP-specific phosphodiesterase class I)/serine phosphatase RsbU (regulator of sigma subunit)